jgi:hypothetical protein
MATLIDVYNNRVGNTMLRNRTQAALSILCWTIFGEAANTADHAARLAWAKVAITSMESYTDQMFWGICGNAAIQAADFAASDGDIQYVVNTIAAGLYL